MWTVGGVGGVGGVDGVGGGQDGGWWAWGYLRWAHHVPNVGGLGLGEQKCVPRRHREGWARMRGMDAWMVVCVERDHERVRGWNWWRHG